MRKDLVAKSTINDSSADYVTSSEARVAFANSNSKKLVYCDKPDSRSEEEHRGGTSLARSRIGNGRGRVGQRGIRVRDE